MWYSRIDSYFMEIRFQRSDCEPTLYRRMEDDKVQLLVYIYVAEIIYMGSSESVVNIFKASLMQAFKMLDLGLLSYFLDLEIKQ